MSHTPHPDDDGCDLGTGMFRGEVVEAGDPLAIARAVARQVAVIAPPEPPADPIRYAVCVDGAPVEDYPTGEEAVVRAAEIRREGYQGSDGEAYEPDVVTVLVWVEEEA